MPNILVTNDDGVHADSIRVLAAALDDLGRVTVIAPERNWSASGHPKTLHKPLRLEPISWPDGRRVYACSGAPSDCVALAILGAPYTPNNSSSHLAAGEPRDAYDLVVSGVNDNFNLGCDVLYSGTVAAAMESLVMGVPSLALSTGSVEGFDIADSEAWQNAAKYARTLAAAALNRPLPPQTMLNVNVPRRPADRIHGLRYTFLGRRIYGDVLVARDDPWGKPYYWIGGEVPTGIADAGSDFGAIESGYVSVSPLGIDLTRHEVLADLAEDAGAPPS
ncbi:MAG: 5'/3'-nucleotidase SurE [Caldilineaceae bacterium SB0670_bin_27]|uniref:5'-nucleotidase SurE n=1 Tax=Caldilineaceae bacterium SB0664_bin_27 TaxID=2605260 RepID=A0A6B0YWZ9_9CHLR|nr:5'/3'-nucleotidase SurE [Caldilineaceae bacterium SB0664_bin_27]MYJ76982.1 5'/3'-nucleotidase SurE [Caldilineaceae bacterium SB0670_bin_27]